MFALIVTSRERRSGVQGNPIMTAEGERFWVERDAEGWVEATSSRCKDPEQAPAQAKVFKTVEAAEAFAKRWTGHPWWCSPRGEFEVVPVRPKYRQVLAGYERR
jgi:uncharacterized membrane protein